MFWFGFFNCFFMSIIHISQVIYGKLFCLKNNQCLYIINFKYDNLKDWIKIIFSFLINSFSFIYYYKTLKNFTPNDILLTVSIFIFFSNIKDFYIEEKRVIYLILFSFIFLIILICILVYLEIMELNFCSLNKYTRKNILKREEEEKVGLIEENKNINDPNRKESEIEIEGYTLDINLNPKNFEKKG